MVRRLKAAVLVAALVTAAPAQADGPVADQHSVWRTCLHEAFALKAGRSSPSLAADAALTECRQSETAYLDALSASPLVDSDDVSRVRPALVARARLWLIGGRSRQL